MSRVSVVRAGHTANAAAVKQAVADAIARLGGFQTLIAPGQTVLLKPNVFAPRPAPTTTDPRVVVAVGELAREAGAGRVVVGEGRSISTAKYRRGANSTKQCFEAVGMRQAVENAGFEIVYLEEDEFCEVEVPNAQVLHTAHVPRTILEADVLVNLPVMKIHSLTTVTLAIKNLHGIVSDYDKLYQHCYRDLALARKLTDLLRIRPPDLNVLDALVGQEADHAADGRPVQMGLIMARFYARVINIKKTYLIPSILVLSIIGSYAIQFSFERWYDLSHRNSSTSGSWHNINSCMPCPPQVLSMRRIHQLLVSSVSMYSCHKTPHNTKIIIQYLNNRSQTVSCAARI